MNKHLNLFQFFSGRESEFLEDNLSRAFALCLMHDAVFCGRVLGSILDPEDRVAFSREQWLGPKIEIDVQRDAKSFESCRKLYAVAASPQELDPGAIEELAPAGVDNPITDVSISLGDLCVVFEFKRHGVDCGPQLRGQAEAIRRNNEGEPMDIVYRDFNWGLIITMAEGSQGFRSQLGSDNVFIRDFVAFLESRYAEWFPPRPLQQLGFPKAIDTAAFKRLHQRLDLIKERLGVAEGFDLQIYKGTYGRTTLKVDWGWTREVLIGFVAGEAEEIKISIYTGETKQQGWTLFKKGVAFGALSSPIAGVELSVQPYLKFRHFNSPVATIYLSMEAARQTHTLDFHRENAGRYRRERWPGFEAKLDGLIPNWRKACAYDAQLISSNRSYFDFSGGLLLEMKIPFTEAQRRDSNNDPVAAVAYFGECIEKLRRVVEAK